jgi:hypothetical protein
VSKKKNYMGIQFLLILLFVFIIIHLTENIRKVKYNSRNPINSYSVPPKSYQVDTLEQNDSKIDTLWKDSEFSDPFRK